MASKEPQGFEKTEYSKPALDANKAYQVIRQVFFDRQKANPAFGVWADMAGSELKVHYHAYEMQVPRRYAQVAEQGETALKEAVKLLKAEFKARTGSDLKLKELKDLANHTCEKVSLNERYYYRCWKVFEVSF